MNTSIPAPIIAATVFSFLFPLALLIWWRVRHPKVGLWPFIAGAICFTVFAMVLEQNLHVLCLMSDNAVSKAINASPLLYTLYAAFAAGIFEETGRLFGFKVLLRRRTAPETAVAYGIGHGGMEVILILGLNYLTMLLACLGVPMGGNETTVIQTANAIPMSTALVAMLERISAVLAHIGLSMLVFRAARDKKKLWLYPLAIFLHALLDGPAMLYRLGMLSIPAVEVFALMMGLIFLALGIRVLRRKDGSAEAAGETLEAPAEEKGE